MIPESNFGIIVYPLISSCNSYDECVLSSKSFLEQFQVFRNYFFCDRMTSQCIIQTLLLHCLVRISTRMFCVLI